MVSFARTLHPSHVAASLEAALTLLQADLEENITLAAFLLVASIFRVVPRKSFGSQFLTAGGHKLLFKYLSTPTAARNGALWLVLAIEKFGAALGDVRDSILEESGFESLDDVWQTYPPLTNIPLLSEEDLSRSYEFVHGRKPDWGTPANQVRPLCQLVLACLPRVAVQCE
jgi:hypothetical protein